MNDKIHQNSETSYQIRVNGVPRYYPMMMGNEAIENWIKLCNKYPNDYVDIVSIRTEIIANKVICHLIKKYFKNDEDN